MEFQLLLTKSATVVKWGWRPAASAKSVLGYKPISINTPLRFSCRNLPREIIDSQTTDCED